MADEPTLLHLLADVPQMIINLNRGLRPGRRSLLRSVLLAELLAADRFLGLFLRWTFGEPLEQAELLELDQVTAILRVYGPELRNHIVAKASSAEAQTLAEGAESTFVNVFVTVLDAVLAILPQADILVP